jgi:hypothetical protein
MISPGRIVLGFTLVAAGVLFLLDSQDVLDAGATISDWWPVLLIVLGALQWISDPRSVAPALVLVGIGAVLLGIRLDAFGSDVWSIFWPLVLIGFGAWVLLGRRRAALRTGSGDTFSAFALLSGRKVAVSSPQFQGGDATAILGAVEVDLTGATPVPGAAITVTVLLGGCDVIVPEGWRATITGTPVLGGWDDTTRRDVVAADAPEIAVRALAILGGVEVRHPKRWGG